VDGQRFQQQECQYRRAKYGGGLEQHGEGKGADAGFDINLERLAVTGEAVMVAAGMKPAGLQLMILPHRETRMRIDSP